MKEFEITTLNGYPIALTVFEANSPKQVLIIAPATGVKQSFYKKFASYLAGNHITVITFDYFGIGKSLKQPIKTISVNAASWGQNDLEAVILYTKTNFSNLPLTLLGHSIGGQLIGLAPSSVVAEKIILVAAQSGYWRFWKGTGRIKMWGNWHLLFPLLTTVFGYMPSKKFSGMENLPRHVAMQWQKWCLSPFYFFGDTSVTNFQFLHINARIMAISIEDDAFAPKQAVDWLSNKFTKSMVTKTQLNPTDFQLTKIGHFGVFKEAMKEPFWGHLLGFLSEY